jgi:hypothetical protein
VKLLLIICTSFLIAAGCKEEPMTIKPSALQNVQPPSWEALSKRKIFFAHQSVGFNIIEGIRDIMQEISLVQLQIRETSEPGDFGQPVFAHVLSGNNQDPESKIDAFQKHMESGLGNKADIAFFKFCYVDITASTDVDAVFSKYQATMAALRTTYPRTTFIHFTVPLTTLQSGLRGLVKRVIGKPIGIEDNLRREQFNAKLRDAYQAQGTLFDLAGAEATSPSGIASAFTIKGETCIQLYPGYTCDGGHLNETGRKKVAAQFLLHLITVSDKLPPRVL